jgi:hypothetical protein
MFALVNGTRFRDPETRVSAHAGRKLGDSQCVKVHNSVSGLRVGTVAAQHMTEGIEKPRCISLADEAFLTRRSRDKGVIKPD